MAQVLKFRRNTTDLSLQDGESGAQIMIGWAPAVARPRYGRPAENVIETMPVRIKGSSQDDLALHLQALAQMQMWAEEYQVDRFCEYPVWLHSQLASETGARRAWVKRITDDNKSGWYDADAINAVAGRTLTVERGAYWENPETVGSEAVTPSAAVSVTVTPLDTADGDVAARICPLRIAPYGSGDELGRLWIGMRSVAQHGTLADFVAIWELEDSDATLGTTDTVTREADATASPGGAGNTYIKVVPAAEDTWAKEVTIKLSDVTSNYAENFGLFLRLLRAKLSGSSSTWEVQLRFGYSDMADDDHIRGPIVEIDSSSWDFYAMGQCSVPLRDVRLLPLAMLSDTYDATFQVQVWARRTSGSKNLYLDCLCPIPLDESWLMLDGFTATHGVGNTDAVYYMNGPNGKNGAYINDATTNTLKAIAMCDSAPGGLCLPTGDAMFVIAYARASSSDITDTISVEPVWYERWLTLRGAE